MLEKFYYLHCWQSVQDPRRIVFENCRCSWNRSSWSSDLKFFHFRKIFQFLLHKTRNVTKGGKGAQFAGAQSLWGTKIHNNVTSTFFKTVHLLPKDLRFEHGGAELVSSPTRHLTSLNTCTPRLSSQNGEICLQKYLPISGKLFKGKCCWLLKSFDHRK